jgi:hypothetical protein
MKKKKKTKMQKAMSMFLDKFDYLPNYPNEVFFNEDEYADFLLKCIEDNFDYTIEKYGTIPQTADGLPEIIYD